MDLQLISLDPLGYFSLSEICGGVLQRLSVILLMPLYQLAVIYQVGVGKRLLHRHAVISSHGIRQSLRTSRLFDLFLI